MAAHQPHKLEVETLALVQFQPPQLLSGIVQWQDASFWSWLSGFESLSPSFLANV